MIKVDSSCTMQLAEIFQDRSLKAHYHPGTLLSSKTFGAPITSVWLCGREFVGLRPEFTY
jgi:hypothetical protein